MGKGPFPYRRQTFEPFLKTETGACVKQKNQMDEALPRPCL